MAPTYSDVKTYPKFGSFVRAAIGLPYAPLERLDEAMAVLRKLARASTGPRRKFCVLLLKYLNKTWLNGNIPREVWNMYQHPGVTTNNHAEVCHPKIKIKMQCFNFRLSITRWVPKNTSPSIQILMFLLMR